MPGSPHLHKPSWLWVRLGYWGPEGPQWIHEKSESVSVSKHLKTSQNHPFEVVWFHFLGWSFWPLPSDTRHTHVTQCVSDDLSCNYSDVGPTGPPHLSCQSLRSAPAGGHLGCSFEGKRRDLWLEVYTVLYTETRTVVYRHRNMMI